MSSLGADSYLKRITRCLDAGLGPEEEEVLVEDSL